MAGKAKHSVQKCFVISPIGTEGSAERRHLDGLLIIIRGILEPKDYTVVAAHEISESGSINRQIIEHLLEDDVVIANLTALNPNVMYELGVRHAAALPTVIIAHKQTDIPFDIAQERAVFFSNDLAGADELKAQLTSTIEATLGAEKPDNPVYRVVRTSVLGTVSLPEPQQAIIERLSDIEEAVSNLTAEFRIGTAGPALRWSSLSAGPRIPAVARAYEEALQRALGTFSIHVQVEGPCDEIDSFVMHLRDTWDVDVHSWELAEGNRLVLVEGAYLTQSQRQAVVDWVLAKSGLRTAIIQSSFDAQSHSRQSTT